MSLTFVAGSASGVFGGALADAMNDELRKRYAIAPSSEEPYRSEPVSARGWPQLQQLGASMLGRDALPQLAGVDPYQSVFVPVDVDKIEQVPVANAADPLQIGSLPRLVEELRRFAAAASLPTDDLELMKLAAHYLESEDPDADLDVQTYVQLMLSAKQAAARGWPLWVVV